MDVGSIRAIGLCLRDFFGGEKLHRLKLPQVCKTLRDVIDYRNECIRLELIDKDDKNSDIDHRELFLKYFMTQTARKRAIILAKKKQNIIVIGSAGTGKTHVINEIMTSLMEKYDNEERSLKIGNTSMTANSAQIITIGDDLPGVTLHSCLGLGTKFHDDHDLDKPIKNYALGKYKKDKGFGNFKFKEARLKELDIIRIDEIGMMSRRMIEFVDEYLKLVMNNNLPFGGKQIIASGDFAQFSPIAERVRNVSNNGESEITVPFSGDFCFKWPGFDAAFPGKNKILLQYSYRQRKDPIYAGILERTRKGRLLPGDIEVLKSRVIDVSDPDLYKKIPDYDSILKVFPTRRQVEQENIRQLAKIDQEEKKFSTIVTLLDSFSKPKTVPKYLQEKHQKTLVLKRFCKVVVTKNIDQSNGLINGAFGTVIRFSPEGWPVVLLENKKTFVMNPRQVIQNLPEGKLVIDEVRLELAYAMTIHRTQGMTFERLVADLGPSAFDSAVYTLLSRLTSLDGLFLYGFLPEKLIENQEVTEFYSKINPFCANTKKLQKFPTKEDVASRVERFVKKAKVEQK